MTEAEIKRMRVCFSVAAVWNGWSAEERDEISAEIAAAIKARDEEILRLWAAWLEDMSGLKQITDLVRAAEQRIKAAKKGKA